MAGDYTFEADRVARDGAYSGIMSKLWRRGRDGERWLSQKNPSLREIRRARQEAGVKQRGLNRLRALLYPYQGIVATTLISTIVFLLLLCLDWVVAYYFAPDDASKYAGAVGTILTSTEVIGAVIGVLIAVVVFAVQYHAEQARDASRLMQYLIRWEGLATIAGVALSIVAAQIVAATIASIWWEPIGFGAAAVDIVAIAFSILLAVYLFHRMLNSISTNFFKDGILPGLTYEYEHYLDVQVLWAIMDRRFRGDFRQGQSTPSELSALSIDWSPFGHSFNDDHIAFGPKFTGLLVDVNLAQLRLLCDVLSKQIPGCRVTFTRGIGDWFYDDHILWVGHESLSSSELEASINSIAHYLNKIIKRTVRFARKKDDELPVVLDAIVSYAVERIRNETTRDIEHVVRILFRLHERLLGRPDIEYLEIEGINLVGFFERKESVYEIARSAGESAHPDTIDVVGKFAIQLAGLSFRHRQPALFQQSLQLLRVMYYRIASSAPPSSRAIERIDTWYGSVVDIEVLQSDRTPVPLEQHRIFSVAAINELLAATRDAIRFGRIQDTLDFHYRMAQIAEKDQYNRRRGELDSVIVNHLCYAQILLVGWYLELARRKIIDVEGIGQLLDDIIKHSRKLNRREYAPWMAVWESHRYGLGVYRCGEDRWMDDLRRWRTGVIYSGSPSMEWIFDGLIMILLKDLPRAKRRHDDPPAKMPEGAEVVDAAMKRVLGQAGVAEVLFSNEDEKIDKAGEGVAALFTDRRVLKRRADIRHIVENPVSDFIRNKTLELAKATIDEDKPGWLTTTNQRNESAILPISVIWQAKDARRWYVDGLEPSSTSGAYYAERLREREQIDLVYIATRLARSAGMTNSVEQLRALIRTTCETLREDGFDPDTIFLPRQSRFGTGLTGEPSWKRSGLDKSLLGQAGTWENLHLYDCPYADPDCVLIVDSKCLWGNNPIQQPYLSLNVKEEHGDANAKLLQEALKAEKEQDIPDASKALVTLEWKLIPRYGLAEPAGSMRIELDLTKLGYALPENDKCYHRPGCELIKGDVEYSLMRHRRGEREERSGCEACKADDWDWELENSFV